MNDRKITTIAIVLVSAGLISSASLAAPISVECSYTKDKKTAFCTTNNEGTESLWRCDKQSNGTWKCGEVKDAAGLESDVEPGLRDAVIGAATRAMEPGSKK
jgi:hypothetical protein